jgi:hypothetical protein
VLPDSLDATDDLVAGHHGDRRVGKLAINDMQIGSADAAREHADENAPRTRDGEIEINGFHLATSGPGQRHRAHVLGRSKALTKVRG